MDNTPAGKKSSPRDTIRPTKRRLIQLFCALLFNAHLRGFASGKIYNGKLKAVCVPGLNCYSCPGAVGACPLGALQNAVSSLNRRIPFYVFGIVMLYGMLLGRTICGWLCPFGLIQELLHKIPSPKIKKSGFTRALSYLKYVILAVFAVLIPLYLSISKGMPVPGFCKYICPAGTLEGAVIMLARGTLKTSMLGALFAWKVVVLAVILAACILCYRVFCRFLCPLGAIYGLFNELSLIGVNIDMKSCDGCGVCVRDCEMDVRRVGDRECIHCGKCVEKCHAHALAMRTIGKKTAGKTEV